MACPTTRKRRFALSQALRVVLLVALLLPLSTFAVDSQRLAVVLSAESALYNELLEAVRNELSGELAAGAVVLETRVLSGDGDAPELPPADLILTVGSRATRAVCEMAETPPVLAALVPRTMVAALRAAGHAPRSVIYLDQPPARLLGLGRALFPAARQAGMLVGPALREELPDYRQVAARNRFALAVQGVEEGANASASIRQLLDESDLVVAPYDPLVFNTDTAKWLLYMAYQRGLPVLGFSLSYVRAGALAAVYSTPEQMGRQAAESVRRWLRDGVRTLPQATYPAYFSVAVNHSVARTLGVEAPAPEVLMQKLSGSLAEVSP